MVDILSAYISDEYTGNQAGGSDVGLPYLQGSIGDKMWLVVEVDIHWETLNCPMTFNATDQTITRTDCNFGVSTTADFEEDGFKVGDIIVVAGTGTANDTSYVVEDITPTVITVTGGITVTGAYATVDIYGDSAVTGIDFYDNVIGTTDPANFTSLTDITSTRKMSIDGITTSSGATAMNFVGGSKAWQDGSVSITGNGTSSYHQKFTITRQFKIVPFYKVNQLQVLKNALAGNTVPPDEWSDTSCMGYIYQVDARYGKTKVVGQSSGIVEASLPYEFGNTGWFNEFLNGGTPEYSLISTSYADHVTSASMTTIDWAKPVDVTCVLKSTNGHFTDQASMPYTLGTAVVVHFCWLPASSDAYQSVQTNYDQSMCYDRVLVYLGGSTLEGDNYGTNYQVLTLVKGTYNSNNQATVTFTVDMAAALKTFFKGKAPNDVNYMIWVTPQQESITSLFNTDRNAVLCDVNTMATDTDNSALLTISTDGTTDIHFFSPPDVEVNPTTDVKAMMGDWWYFKCDFLVPSGANIHDIVVKFQAVLYDTLITTSNYDNILETVDLDTTTASTASSFDGVQNNINFYQPTSYPGSGSDPRASRTIMRKPSLDSGGNLGYEMLYGFQVGYQSWRQVINTVPEFLQVGTKLWSGYFTDSAFNGGSLPADTNTRVDLLVTWHVEDPATGIITEFNQRCNISAGDSGMNIDNIPVTLITEDNVGQDMGGIIASDQQTVVMVKFDASSIAGLPAPPAGYQYRADMYFWYDNGTSQILDPVNNYSEPNAGSLWISPVDFYQSPGTDWWYAVAILDPSISKYPIKNYRLICNLSYQHT